MGTNKNQPWARFEEYVNEILDLRPTISSGNKHYDTGDGVTADRHAYFPVWADAKCTEAKSFSLKVKDLTDWMNHAFMVGRRFVLPIRFHNARGVHSDFVLLALDDFKELLDKARNDEAHQQHLRETKGITVRAADLKDQEAIRRRFW